MSLKAACRVISGKNGPPEEEMIEAPLMAKHHYTTYIGVEGSIVDSVFVGGPGQNDIEALSTAPIEFTAQVPPHKDPEQKQRKMKVQGPHGLFEVTLPEDAEVGQQVRYRLGPPPEFRIEVPPKAKPGAQARFKRRDGVEVTVTIPPGHQPGDFFEVTPPVHMVKVPAEASAGAQVVFKLTDRSLDTVGKDGVARQAQAWCRAVVPAGLLPGQYFPARLPPPPKAGLDAPLE